MNLQGIAPTIRGIVMATTTLSTPLEDVQFSDLAPSDRKFEFRATQKDPDAVLQIRKGAALLNTDMAVFARDAVAAAYERVLAGLPIRGQNLVKDSGFNSFTAPYLSAVPCGPWAEAIDRAERFTISTETADELEAQDGDVWVRADGQSMEGAGVMDGVLVLVRPYDRKTPRRGEIVLIQVMKEDGEYLSTLKRFDGMDGQRPKLLDGSDEAYDLPESSVAPDIVGRAIATLGRL